MNAISAQVNAAKAEAAKKQAKKEVKAIKAEVAQVLKPVKRPVAIDAMSLVASQARASSAVKAQLQNASGNIKAIAQAYALPFESESVHASDPVGAMSTAMAKTYRRESMSMSAGTGPHVPFTGFLIVRRDPLASAIYPIYSSSTTACGASFYYSVGGSTPSLSAGMQTGRNEALPFAFVRPTSGLLFNDGAGDQYAHTLNGDQATERLVWIDEGVVNNAVTTTNTAAGGVTNATFTWYRFDGKSVQFYTSNNITVTNNGSANANSTLISGYYSCRVNIQSTVPASGLYGNALATCSQTWTAAAAPMQIVHAPMSEIAMFADAVDGMRMNVSSALFTNTTPVISRGGSIVGYLAAPGQNWMHLLFSSSTTWVADPYDAIASKVGAVSLDATNGMYASNRPTSTTEVFEFDDFFSTSAAAGVTDIVDSYAPLVQKSSDLVVAWRLVTGSTAVVTLTCVCEYTTDVQYLERSMPRYTPEEFVSAIQLLATLPNFTENPLHLSEIKDSIARAGGDVYNLTRGFLKGVRTLSKDAKRTVRDVAPNISHFLEGIL